MEQVANVFAAEKLNELQVTGGDVGQSVDALMGDANPLTA